MRMVLVAESLLSDVKQRTQPQVADCAGRSYVPNADRLLARRVQPLCEAASSPRARRRAIEHQHKHASQLTNLKLISAPQMLAQDPAQYSEPECSSTCLHSITKGRILGSICDRITHACFASDSAIRL